MSNGFGKRCGGCRTEILTGTAALDLDWDDPQARNVALSTILQTLNSVESWVKQNRFG